MKAHLVFIDESGLLMAPLVRRTWAPTGSTPFLYQKTRSYKKVSMLAALSVAPIRARIGLYFSLSSDSNINAQKIVRFLKTLSGHLQKPIFILWDNSRVHRSKAVNELLEKHRRLHIAFFPAYAPELNPVEIFWGYLKNNPLANFVPLNTQSLSRKARYHSQQIRHRSDLLHSFLRATPLF
jgi:transposase